MSESKKKPIFDLSQAEVVERIAVTFLFDINISGQIKVKKYEVHKGELYSCFSDVNNNYLLVDFDDKGTVKIPIKDVKHPKYGTLLTIHYWGSEEAKKVWDIKEDNIIWELKVKEEPENGN